LGYNEESLDKGKRMIKIDIKEIRLIILMKGLLFRRVKFIKILKLIRRSKPATILLKHIIRGNRINRFLYITDGIVKISSSTAVKINFDFIGVLPIFGNFTTSASTVFESNISIIISINS